MASDLEEAGDRLVVELEPGGPVELSGLTESFAALARMYERHYRKGDDAAPKLFVTKLTTGSIIAEIAPYAVALNQAYAFAGSAITIADFAKRLNSGLLAFAGMTTSSPSAVAEQIDRDDAASLREFVKPLSGRRGAELKIRHARFYQKDGDREIVAEYDFDEAAINRAVVNIDKALETLPEPTEGKSYKPHKEVMLFFDSASRGKGRESGRTRDYGVIPEITEKALPVYFRTSVQGNLKDVMVRGAENPLANVAFIVDVHAQLIGGEPKGYIVTEVHQTVQLGDDEPEAA